MSFVMNQSIKFIVSRPDKICVGNFKEVYCNMISIDDLLTFDYRALIKGLRLLYPFSVVIIVFSIT